MSIPDFRLVCDGQSAGVTYTCGCPCTPTARLRADGTPGFEHCCCGKVHFAGDGAAAALDAYLAERRARPESREPTYATGAAHIEFAAASVEVAWAFPYSS